MKMTALQFGNMQKMNGPTENCEDPTTSLPDNCTDTFVRIFLINHLFFFQIYLYPSTASEGSTGKDLRTIESKEGNEILLKNNLPE